MKPFAFSREPKSYFQSEQPPLEVMRTYFATASESEKQFKEGYAFLQSLLKSQPENIVWQAYQAAFKTIEAQYTYFPLDKLRKATEGLNQMDRLVLQNPSELEVRFIRMAVLYRLPSFLGRNAEAMSEARKIYQEITTARISESLRNYILEFLKQTNLKS